MISKECEKCAFYNPSDKDFPCLFDDVTIKCSILKEFVKDLEFKRKVKL